ncbi:MAG: hypothetical protein K2L59_06055, partial [Muribaculaceae bacterium]|nr:hypothetical protein [Muribaculaceae bacterium]
MKTRQVVGYLRDTGLQDIGEEASYLLVTPVYLSRIRKKLAKKQANKTCFIPKSFFLPNFDNQLYWQMD